MVSYNGVVDQLQSIGLRYRFIGKKEVIELARILKPDESIKHCCFGFYEGGTALFVATDQRLLLVDKRMFFFNLEDIRYEMVNQLDFSSHLLWASVYLHTGNKRLEFRSYADSRLKDLFMFSRDQITSMRKANYTAVLLASGEYAWRKNTLDLPRRHRVANYYQQKQQLRFTR